MKARDKLFFFIFVSMLACTPSRKDIPGPASFQFFDLKGFFKGETKRLHSQRYRPLKTVFANGKTERRFADVIDYKKELDFFAGADINRPAWSGKYIVDTLFNEQNQILRLHYRCTDKKLTVRNIIIYYENKEVNKIFVETCTSNSIVNSSQKMVYQPKVGYSIKSQQSITMGAQKDFKVDVKFHL